MMPADSHALLVVPQFSPSPRDKRRRLRRLNGGVGPEGGGATPRLALDADGFQATRSLPPSMVCMLPPLPCAQASSPSASFPGATLAITNFPHNSGQEQSVGGQSEVRAGLQRVYLEGLEFLRTKIGQTEAELERVVLDYYQCSHYDEDDFVAFSKKADGFLLQANHELRRHDIALSVVDSEGKLVSLLNQLRELPDADPKSETVEFLTEYWETVKMASEGLQTVVAKFQSNVLTRLQVNCTSYCNADINLEVSQRYTRDISAYLTNLERILGSTQLLLHSYSSGLHQDLFELDDSEMAQKLLLSCDLKAFPLLRFVEDVSSKIQAMMSIARHWIARDEQYMYEVNDYIRQMRRCTKRREEDLKNQKEKQKKFEKSLKAANILLTKNREKLTNLETELVELESKMEGAVTSRRSLEEEKQHKANMVDFLKVTLAQTKRNYSLQAKRSKLLKQVQELEALLSDMERDMSSVQQQIASKAQQRSVLEEKVVTSQRSCGALKTDANRFSEELEKLESEVNSLTSQLLQLEIIQTFKTSPEKIEEIYDRPSTVKLSPSLKEKIKERKRKTLARAQ